MELRNGNKKAPQKFAVLKKSSAYSLVVICDTKIEINFLNKKYYGKNFRT